MKHFVFSPGPIDHYPLPSLRLIHRNVDEVRYVNVEAEIRSQWPGVKRCFRPGSEVALAVGSRGIGDIVPAVRALVTMLREDGAKPFVVPAMGSHGGGTAAGQLAVLASLGITEESTGAPIRGGVESVALGYAEGIPLFMDRRAYDADAVVLVNRIKPHTDFMGRVESGPMKMLAIGLGGRSSASLYHRLGVERGLGEVILAAARGLLRIGKVALAIALVESEEHKTVAVRLALPADLEAVEMELLGFARKLEPRLPVADIDLLIVDEMGKDVSGAGMDPNVVGRTSPRWAMQREKPRIGRIFVRDLTPATEGNAMGLGMVDAITTRLLEKIDMQSTAVNALSSCDPEDCRIPLTLNCDRDAIAALLGTVRRVSSSGVRVVRIRNTLDLRRVLVSTGCLPQIRDQGYALVDSEDAPMRFDDHGNLGAW